MKYHFRHARLFLFLILVPFLVAPVEAAKTFELTDETENNPAAELFRDNFQAEFNEAWFTQAGDHWQARTGDSWQDYIEMMTQPDPPEELPELPSASDDEDADEEICEAVGTGRCFYISGETGDDEDSGSYDAPWKTYRNVVYFLYSLLPENHTVLRNGGLKPGDVVYFKSGIYDLTYVSGEDDGTELKNGFYLFNLHGTADAPITFKAYPGDRPVFSAKLSDGETLMPAAEIANSSHIVLDGLEVTGSYGDGVRVHDSTEVEITGCRIHQAGGPADADIAGISGLRNIGLRIHHNLIHDNGGETADAESSVHKGNVLISQGYGSGGDILIQNNIIFNTPPAPASGLSVSGGFGIRYIRSADYSSYPDARFEADHNVILNCMTDSVASAAFNTRIHHNLILSSAPVFIGEFGSLAYHTGTEIRNNTIAGGRALIYNPTSVYGPPGSFSFRSNIVIDRENLYGTEIGTVQICTYCGDTLFDAVVTGDTLTFDDNIYCNPFVDLELEPAWLLFNYNGSQFEQPNENGDEYSFAGWQALGYDEGSSVYYGYETPELVIYPFDGDAQDESGDENHGVVRGAAGTYDRFAKSGGALDFNGTDSYVATPVDVNPAQMPVLTLAAWVYPRIAGGTVHSGRRQIFSQEDGGYDRSLLMEYDEWHVFTGGENWDTGAEVDIKMWQHVAVVFQEDDVIFYKNGEAYAFGSEPGDGASLMKLMIGNSPQPAWDEFFDGVIDDAVILNRALCAEEIQALMIRNTETCPVVQEDLSIPVSLEYEDQFFRFTLVYDQDPDRPDNLLWKIDMDTVVLPEYDPGDAIEVRSNLDFDICVQLGEQFYTFTFVYYPREDDTSTLYWHLDDTTFREIRKDCIPIDETLAMPLVVEDGGSRYAFNLYHVEPPGDASGYYWRMASDSYPKVNHVTENYIQMGEDYALDFCVSIAGIQYSVTFLPVPVLSDPGGMYWKLDPTSFKEL